MSNHPEKISRSDKDICMMITFCQTTLLFLEICSYFSSRCTSEDGRRASLQGRGVPLLGLCCSGLSCVPPHQFPNTIMAPSRERTYLYPLSFLVPDLSTHTLSRNFLFKFVAMIHRSLLIPQERHWRQVPEGYAAMYKAQNLSPKRRGFEFLLGCFPSCVALWLRSHNYEADLVTPA